MGRFQLGRVMITPAAREAIHGACEEVLKVLGRHAACDWGDVGPADAKLNDRALTDGTRLFSVYVLRDGETKVWIITEADRSATTVLLPEEY